MTIAQKLHAFVSFLCGEKPESQSPQMTAREKLTKATKVSEFLEAYGNLGSSAPSDEQVFERLKRVARTFDDWLMAMRYIGQGTELGRLVSESVISSASSFNEWRQIFVAARDDVLPTRALEKMHYLARSLEEKVDVYDLSQEGSQIHEIVSNELKQTAKSYKEWDVIFNSAESGSALESYAKNKLVECVPETPSDLKELLDYNLIHDDVELREAVLVKLRVCSGTLDVWKTLYDSGGDDVQKIAAEKMVAAIGNVDELLMVAEAGEGDYYVEEKLIPRLQTLIVERKDLDKILQGWNTDSGLFVAAVEKLLELSTTFAECLEIYVSWVMDGEENLKVLEKMAQLANPTELRIVALASEKDGELEQWAYEQLGEND